MKWKQHIHKYKMKQLHYLFIHQGMIGKAPDQVIEPRHLEALHVQDSARPPVLSSLSDHVPREDHTYSTSHPNTNG